jgi:hypothetical protein
VEPGESARTSKESGMSFSKVLCIAAAGSILFTSAAMARPDTTPPTKTHHKHKALKKGAHKHHRKHKGSGSQPQ